LHARFLAIRSSDSYGRTGVLRQQCEEVLNSLQTFNAQFASVLPEPVSGSISATNRTYTIGGNAVRIAFGPASTDQGERNVAQ